MRGAVEGMVAELLLVYVARRGGGGGWGKKAEGARVNKGVFSGLRGGDCDDHVNDCHAYACTVIATPMLALTCTRRT